MCLGIPGRIESIYEENGLRMGRVDFNGIRRETCLSAVSEAEIGDFVMVHAGFAISRIHAEDAAETNAILEEIDRLNASL